MNVRNVLPRDAIPSIDDPEFGSEYIGDADDDVLVLETDPPRAYPTRILNYHEIVNDEADGPVAVTWCPLCGSGVVYERVVDGRELTFGVSGKLADDDLVMYDRETGSEWKQSRGIAIAGDLEGTELSVRPATMLPWARFREAYPDGVVLQPAGGESEAASDDDEPAPVEYDAEPYDDYVAAEGFGLGAHRGTGGRDWDREDLDPKDVVLGLEQDGEALGVPLARVEEAGGVVTTTVGETDVVVFATDEGIHAFRNPGIEFEPVESAGDESESAGPAGSESEPAGPTGSGESDTGAFAGDGTTWDGATGRSADGRRLERLPARRLFAFTWQDDHGPDTFYG